MGGRRIDFNNLSGPLTYTKLFSHQIRINVDYIRFGKNKGRGGIIIRFIDRYGYLTPGTAKN